MRATTQKNIAKYYGNTSKSRYVVLDVNVPISTHTSAHPMLQGGPDVIHSKTRWAVPLCGGSPQHWVLGWGRERCHPSLASSLSSTWGEYCGASEASCVSLSLQFNDEFGDSDSESSDDEYCNNDNDPNALPPKPIFTCKDKHRNYEAYLHAKVCMADVVYHFGLNKLVGPPLNKTLTLDAERQRHGGMSILAGRHVPARSSCDAYH